MASLHGISILRLWLILNLACIAGGCALTTPAPGDHPTIKWIERAHRAETLDDAFRSLAFAVPGFAGLYIEEANTLTVRLSPGGRREQAQEVVRRYWQRARPESIEDKSDFRIVFKDARWSWFDLHSHRQALVDVLSLPGVTLLDADEVCNCVRIGIEEDKARGNVDTFVRATQVPPEAVNVVIEPAVQPVAWLRDGFRPVPGGVRIKAATNFFSFLGVGSICTVTIPAMRGATPGFVTNSHCAATMGVVELIEFFQAGMPGVLFKADYVGVEIVDPPFTTTPLSVSATRCPSGRTCRFSDSAFIRLDTAMPGELARIARPEMRCFGTTACSINMTNSSDRFTVRGIAGATDGRLPGGGPGRIVVGTVVEKVGQMSGWTAGAVRATCVDRTQRGTTLILLCQNDVASIGLEGDSGAPVFLLNQGGDVVLEGILWGASEPPAPSRFIYSPMIAVEREIGSLSFFPLVPSGAPLTECQKACGVDRDACMAMVGTDGGPRPADCVAELRSCERQCP